MDGMGFAPSHHVSGYQRKYRALCYHQNNESSNEKIMRGKVFTIFVVVLMLSSPVGSAWAEQADRCFGACERIDISSTQDHRVKYADAQALAFRTASFIQEDHIELLTRVDSGSEVQASVPASPASADRAVINPTTVKNTGSEGSSNPMPRFLIIMGFGLIGLRLIVSYRSRKSKNSNSDQ
jgi:hypothetical protein